MLWSVVGWCDGNAHVSPTGRIYVGLFLRVPQHKPPFSLPGIFLPDAETSCHGDGFLGQRSSVGGKPGHLWTTVTCAICPASGVGVEGSGVGGGWGVSWPGFSQAFHNTKLVARMARGTLGSHQLCYSICAKVKLYRTDISPWPMHRPPTSFFRVCVCVCVCVCAGVCVCVEGGGGMGHIASIIISIKYSSADSLNVLGSLAAGFLLIPLHNQPGNHSVHIGLISNSSVTLKPVLISHTVSRRVFLCRRVVEIISRLYFQIS